MTPSKVPAVEFRSLSSNSLFHFTSLRENLEAILADRFHCRYSREDFTTFADELVVAVPMVCFCDIPLSQTAAHVEAYGSYGLGLTKEWGNAWGVSPVLYASRESETSRIVDRLGAQIATLLERYPTVEGLRDVLAETLRMFAFVKPYQGVVRGPDGTERPKVFYDEREWRFVPVHEDHPTLIAETLLREAKISDRANETVRNLGPSFEGKDVRYIIVEREDEIPDFVKFVLSLDRFHERDRGLLASRIISTQQILEDF